MKTTKQSFLDQLLLATTNLRQDSDLLVALLPVAPALFHHRHDDVLGGHEGQLCLDPPLDHLSEI